MLSETRWRFFTSLSKCAHRTALFHHIQVQPGRVVGRCGTSQTSTDPLQNPNEGSALAAARLVEVHLLELILLVVEDVRHCDGAARSKAGYYSVCLP